MAHEQRSPFGDLVFRHRHRLNLTQLKLAREASLPSRAGLEAATVSERTVAAIEQLHTDPTKWHKPRTSTVAALVDIFGLARGTPDYDEFVAAARARPPRPIPTSASAPASRAPRDALASPPEIDDFLPAGREPHLARLHRAIDSAVAGIPGAIFVRASPGAGKSALLEHACIEAVNRHDRIVVLWGECTAHSGIADPHQPFRQILGTLTGDTAAAGPRQLVSPENERRIGIRTADGIDALLDVGDGLIDRLVSAATLRSLPESGALDSETSARLIATLANSPGGRPNPHEDRELLFRVLSRYAAAGPTIIVLEDLHWADPGAVSLIMHAIKRLHDQQAPVLILGSYRPADLEPAIPGDHHPLPSMLRESTRFFDDPVLDLSTAIGGDAGRAFVDAMVAQSISNAPDAFAETLFEHTGGLPLFVLGMIRWCRTEGIIGDDGESHDALRWTPDPANLPTEIDMVFAEQFSRLPFEAQSVVNAASVQGNAFSAEVTMRLLGLDRPVMIGAIDDTLTRRYQMMEPGGVVTVACQVSHTYRFTHVLLREYIYGQLTELEQAHYHAATAEAMLGLYGEAEHDGAGAIAFHFDRAGDRLKAGAAYMKAGHHALEGRDFDAARRHFERIGELDLRREDPFAVAQALIGLGNCAYGQGDNASASRLFEEAHDLAQRKQLPLLVGSSLHAAGWVDYNAGRMRVGANRLRVAIGVLIDLGNAHETSRAYILHSHLLHGIGHYDEAAAAARQAIAMGKDHHDDMVIVSGLTALGNCSIGTGHYAEAIAMYERGIAICDEHGEVHRATLCWYNISLCELEREEWDRSRAALEIIFDPTRNATSRLLSMGEFTAGIVAEGRGNFDEADRRYGASLDLRVKNGQDGLAVDSLAGLLRVATARHDHDRMRSLIADIDARVEERGVDGVEHYGRLFVTLIDAFIALDDLDEARNQLRKGTAFIMERADLLADPGHRASYLTNVPAHRRLFDLAAELGVPAEE